ncbi:MAG: MTAP family purine nucleoside phosphorylase [Chloroflexota bacterium]
MPELIKLAILTSQISAGYFENPRDIVVATPWGDAPVTVGTLGGHRVAGLMRYGPQRNTASHHINFRANIWALRELGVERIVSQNAIGSVNPMLQPGDVVISDDFIDLTKNRPLTLYDTDQSWVRVDMTEPFCPEMRRALVSATRGIFGRAQDGGTFICVEGPRFETPAEIRMYHQWGADIIGTPLVPEVVFAREAGICFASIAPIINYGSGLAPAVIQTGAGSMTDFYYSGNLHTNTELAIARALDAIPAERGCHCGDALQGALNGPMPEWVHRPPAGVPDGAPADA